MRDIASRIRSVAEARYFMKGRVPKSVFQMFVAGSGFNVTTICNVQAFEDMMFRSRGAVFHPEHASVPQGVSLREAIRFLSQITRRSQGKPAQPENAWLLRDLATAVSRLADHFEPATIYKWLYGSNPDLEGASPLELLRQGRLAEVLMTIESQTSGAFS